MNDNKTNINCDTGILGKPHSDSLGIPNYGLWYFEVLPEQDLVEEFIETYSFIKTAISSIKIPEFQGKKTIQFINYGETQLVYVCTVNNNRQYTLLVNQPRTRFGTGKMEYDNLLQLHNNNQGVIKPLCYFGDKKRELYVTPYYYQARCIGIDEDEWGMWIPEPEYYFKDFTDGERQIINSSMVAMLIELYDDKRKLGLSECRLDGGDFMLEKGFENQELTNENILRRMKLIAARKLISIEFNEYIERIRKELSGKEENNSYMIIGKTLKNPMYIEEIERGIQLGLENKKKKREIYI